MIMRLSFDSIILTTQSKHKHVMCLFQTIDRGKQRGPSRLSTRPYVPVHCSPHLDFQAPFTPIIVSKRKASTQEPLPELSLHGTKHITT